MCMNKHIALLLLILTTLICIYITEQNIHIRYKIIEGIDEPDNKKYNYESIASIASVYNGNTMAINNLKSQGWQQQA